MTSPLLISKLILATLIHKFRYCGGNTQLVNLTNLFSLDYAFISQFVSNGATYLITELPNIKEQLQAALVDAEVMPTADIQDCLNSYNNDTEVDDKKEGKKG